MSAAVLSACGLRGYVSARDALATVVTSGKPGRWRRLGPQRCEVCGWWHLGDRRADTGYVRLRESDDA